MQFGMIYTEQIASMKYPEQSENKQIGIWLKKNEMAFHSTRN